ncbi:hypothetical protein V8C86DRAFT_2567766 [Haematococcus lacustris]
MPHRQTIQERVVEAAVKVQRAGRHDPDYLAESPVKSNLVDRVMDPNSDWPEPALKGEHLAKEKARWLPAPTSPTMRAANRARGTAVQHPGPGSATVGRDAVQGIARAM